MARAAFIRGKIRLVRVAHNVRTEIPHTIYTGAPMGAAYGGSFYPLISISCLENPPIPHRNACCPTRACTHVCAHTRTHAGEIGFYGGYGGSGDFAPNTLKTQPNKSPIEFPHRPERRLYGGNLPQQLPTARHLPDFSNCRGTSSNCHNCRRPPCTPSALISTGTIATTAPRATSTSGWNASGGRRFALWTVGSAHAPHDGHEAAPVHLYRAERDGACLAKQRHVVMRKGPGLEPFAAGAYRIGHRVELG